VGLVETDRKVAEELAGEVRAASGGPRTWRRVATLLEEFGVERLSDHVRERISAALADVRIEVRPPLDHVDRDAMVQLIVPDTVWEEAAGVSVGDGARPVITGTNWSSGGLRTELDLDSPRPKGGTVWFDVDPARATPDQVLDELWPFCGSEFTREMSEDLLDAGRRPGVRSYGGDGRVRLVTVFEMETQEHDRVTGVASASKAGTIVFRSVGLLVGSDWLITCWHEDPLRTASLGVMDAVVRRFHGGSDTPTPGDIGINVMYVLMSTYPATERRLRAWLDAWEADFHAHLDDTSGPSLAGLERATLVDLRTELSQLRSHLHAFERPGVDPGEAWFTNLRDRETPLRTREVINSTLSDVADLDSALRTSLDLLVTTSAAEQAEAAGAQAVQARRLNQQVALVTSVLLVPSFLAELFGTGPYPGGKNWWQFALLLIAMVVLGWTTYRLLTRRRVP
jgi:hypothetical protein